MKKLMIASMALALLASPASAFSIFGMEIKAPSADTGEHCVTRDINANYTGGSLKSKQCFSSENGYSKPAPEKKCEYHK